MSAIAMVWTGSVLKGTGEKGSSTWNCSKGVETFQRWDLGEVFLSLGICH